MSVEGLLKLTRRRIGTIVAGIVLGVALAVGALWMTPTSFTASAVAYVRVVVPAGDSPQNQSYSYYAASQLATQKVKAFVSVFTSEAVARGVIDSLGLAMTPAQLSRSLTAANQDDSLTITVSARAPTADDAQRIADEVVRQSQVQVKRLEGEDSPVDVVLMSPSSLSATTRQPSAPRYLAVGALGGVLLGYAGATLVSMLDKRIRSSSDLSEVVDIPVIGVVPSSEALSARSRDGSGDPGVEESLRKLRTNLRYAGAGLDEGLRSLVVSSCVQDDGKSTIAVNLARVVALAGQEVILIEGDLRRPRLRRLFNAGKNRPGLAQLLVGATSLESALVTTPVPGLRVIFAGDSPPNPSELLGSSRLSELVKYLATDHVVLIDAPPVLPVTDAVALAEHVDGMLMIVRAGHTTSDQLRQAMTTLTRGGGKVIGLVLNQVAVSALGKFRYGGSDYYFDHEYREDPEPQDRPARAAGDAGRAAQPPEPPEEAHRPPRGERRASSASTAADFVAMLEQQRVEGDRPSDAPARAPKGKRRR